MERGIDINMTTEYSGRGRLHSVADILQDILVMAMLISGVAGQFLQWTGIRGLEYIHMWGMLGVAVIATVILGYKVKSQLFSYLTAPAIALVAAVIHGPASIYYGFFGMINYMISWWNLSHEDAVTLVMEDQISADDVRGCVMVIALILVPIWWNIVRHRRIFVGMLIIWAFVIPGLAVHSVSAGACGAFVAGWFGLLLVRGELAFGVRGLVWQLIVGGICICASMLAGSDRVNAVTGFKEQLDAGADHIRYGQDTLPEGDLSKADRLLAGDEPTLEVSSDQKKNIYLRGFTGARYKEGVWTELPGASYRGKNDGMFSWLSDRNFLVQDQYAHYEKAGGSESAVPANHITVKNVGANRRYVYVPYSAEIPSGTKVSLEQDFGLTAAGIFGAGSYACDDWSGDRPGELLYADSWVDSPVTDSETQYVDAESVYSDFVYDNYLDVSDDMSALIDKVFSEATAGSEAEASSDSADSASSGWADAETIYSVTEQIRDALSSTVSYVAEPDIPEDEDPIEWFLTDGREGNAVLYASAAVMAFRCKKIPARYAEGYIYPGDSKLPGTAGTVNEAGTSDGTASGKLTLTNKNSHAWAEVYLDGVGWIPVDVTPGFYYDTYTLLQMVKKPQNINESAANDDSSNLGSQMDEDNEQNTTGSRHDDEKKTPAVISLDILAVLLLLAVLAVVMLEIRYFVKRSTITKRYEGLSAEEKTAALTAVIFRLLRLYGCDAAPGWNEEDTDAMIAAGLFGHDKTDSRDKTASHDENSFYEGEYLRISAIMEKHIYGEQELTAAELRTLYIFAEKLYEAGQSAGLKVRLKLRYGII